MFSDGIRPGGDLTELDAQAEARFPPARSGRKAKRVEKAEGSYFSIPSYSHYFICSIQGNS